MNEKLYSAVNDQINFELHSSHIYLNIATYFDDLGLSGFANFFYVQFEEETFHARKLMTYLVDRNQRPIIEAMPPLVASFSSSLEAIELALAHEKSVTKRFSNLMMLARDVSDFATEGILTWFINEQVEEESTLGDLITKVKLVKDAGLYVLDQELAARTFTPPII